MSHEERRDRHTFIVKAVNAIDRGTFVVASQQKEIFRIFDLVRQKQANCLKTLIQTNKIN
jgi:hypothetical protein